MATIRSFSIIYKNIVINGLFDADSVWGWNEILQIWTYICIYKYAFLVRYDFLWYFRIWYKQKNFVWEEFDTNNFINFIIFEEIQFVFTNIIMENIHHKVFIKALEKQCIVLSYDTENILGTRRLFYFRYSNSR